MNRYLPMMRTKAGEITALRMLSPAARARVLPVFHMCATIAAGFGSGLSAAWAGQPTALDGSWNAGQHGSSHMFQGLLAAMRSGGIPTIPVVGQTDPGHYQAAVHPMVGPDGVAVKATLGQLPSVPAWIASAGWSPADVDLIVDLKHIAGFDLGSFSGYVLSSLNSASSSFSSFRSVTLASGAAPKDAGSLSRGVNRITRLDWHLWNAIHPHLPLVDYADYMTGHPDLTDPPGAAMATATVSARYSLDNEWLIIKGFPVGGATGQPMDVQYRAHANTIVADPGFNGIPNCWADTEIAAAASVIAGRGSRQKWSEFAANRHMSLVADRLP